MKERDCPINKINKFSFGSGWQRAIREEVALGDKEYNIAVKKEWERSLVTTMKISSRI